MSIEGFRERYLERLGLDPAQELPLTAQTLSLLQEAHCSTVPFEIIDSMLGVHIDLRSEALFDKIVLQRRGGFCYEVNGLLALFLEDLGFSVERLAGWVPSCKGRFDHIFLRVEAEGQQWLVDVGFRNGSLVPLRFEVGLEQDGVKADYRIDRASEDEAGTDGFGDASYWLMRKPKGTEEWLKAFRFDDTVFAFEDYFERCYDFAEGGWSPFQRRPSCSLETRFGEIYLNDDVFVDVVDGALVQRKVAGAADFAQVLLRTFGVLTNPGDMLHAVASDDVPVDVADVVALEKEIDANGTSLRELMERAGAAVATAVAGMVDMQCVKPWDSGENQPHVMVLAGNGNNGGDGWVVADILHQNGYSVSLVTERSADSISAQPASQVVNEIMLAMMQLASANNIAAAMGQETAPLLDVEVNPEADALDSQLMQSAVIVDALLGTGFDSEQVREPFATWIRLVNKAQAAGVPVISVDVPSGLSAQTGAAADACVNADATITMLRMKKGLAAEGAAEHTGHVFIADLQ